MDLSPNNLTKSEDWVWLRLTDYEKFSTNEIKGSARWNEIFPEPLKISQTENSDMHHVMGMIEELAIYENMLDQFWGLTLGDFSNFSSYLVFKCLIPCSVK